MSLQGVYPAAARSKDMQSAQGFPVITRNTQTYNEKHK